MTYYVFSTLTAGQLYTTWSVPAPGGAAIPKRQILINGGSNVADKNVVTRIGVMTKVEDEDMKVLEGIELFNLHKNNGFITVRKAKAEAEAVAADMVTRDASAPTTPADLEAEAAEAAKAGLAVATVKKK